VSDSPSNEASFWKDHGAIIAAFIIAVGAVVAALIGRDNGSDPSPPSTERAPSVDAPPSVTPPTLTPEERQDLKPLRVVVGIDISGSMTRPVAPGESENRITAAVRAAGDGLGQSERPYDIALWSFGRSPPAERVTIGTTGMGDAGTEQLDDVEGGLRQLAVEVGAFSPEERKKRGTRLYDMIVAGVNYLQKVERRDPRPDRINALIIVSDGVDTTSIATGSDVNELLAGNKNVEVLTTATFGEVRCDELPRNLEAFDNDCFTVKQAEDVERTLSDILERLQRQRQR